MLNLYSRKQLEPWLSGNAFDYYWGQWFDSDRSDLRSNLMQVDTLFLTLLLFAIQGLLWINPRNIISNMWCSMPKAGSSRKLNNLILLLIHIEDIHSFKMTSHWTLYLIHERRYFIFSACIHGNAVSIKSGLKKLYWNIEIIHYNHSNSELIVIQSSCNFAHS